MIYGIQPASFKPAFDLASSMGCEPVRTVTAGIKVPLGSLARAFPASGDRAAVKLARLMTDTTADTRWNVGVISAGFRFFFAVPKPKGEC
jgi:hypothetical protein